MARSCLDRGEKIYTVAKLEQRPLALFRLASPSPIQSPTQTLPPIGNGDLTLSLGYVVSISSLSPPPPGAPPSHGHLPPGAPPSHGHLPLEKMKTWPDSLAPPTRSLINVRAVGVGREDNPTQAQSEEAQSPRCVCGMASFHNEFRTSTHKHKCTTHVHTHTLVHTHPDYDITSRTWIVLSYITST